MSIKMKGKMQLEDWLDDLCVRFIINIPEEDLSSVARICFQIEEAQWFYEDFIRPLDPSLPSMSLRIFFLRIFKHCPLLAHFSEENHLKAFEDFLEYKARIPVRGAIMLNHEMDSTVLVKGWKKGASWTFPAGKINKAEDDLDCAIREVWEETGLDLKAAGLVPIEQKPEYIELPIRGHQVRLYVFGQVPMDFDFQPQTRKEISRIDWYKLSDLPGFRRKHTPGNGYDEAVAGVSNSKFYMIAPFMPLLKKWVASQKRKQQRNFPILDQGHLSASLPVEEDLMESDHWAQSENYSQDLPAVENLDEASQELRRLLKMHATGDGAKPLPQTSAADKGSALLSILQAKGSIVPGAADLPSDTQPQPQPSYDMYGRPPQAFGFEQHINQQQPTAILQPPHSSSVHKYHSVPMQVRNQPAPPKPYQQVVGVEPPDSHSSVHSPITLLHPQPLPPQVQRQVFNKSTFQMPSINTQAMTARQGFTALSLSPSQSARQPPIPPQQSSQRGPTALDGRSQALLDAFKRSAQTPLQQQRQVPGQSAPDVVTIVPQQQRHYSQYTSPGHEQLMSVGSYPGNSSRPIEYQSPHELAGTSMTSPPSQQTSSLLGLFKKSESIEQSAPQRQREEQRNDTSTGHPLHLSQQDKPASQNSNPYPPNDRTAQAALNKRMEHLALFSRKGGDAPVTNAAASLPHQQPATSRGQQAQNQNQPPFRILQRGRMLDTSVEDSTAPSITQRSSHVESQAPASMVAHKTSSIGTPPVDNGPQSGTNQKRQLLSLFGPQSNTWPATNRADGHNGQRPTNSEGKSASTTSSAKRDEVPISPADQSFLLGYLQTIAFDASKKA